jgi:hypothetical protein
MKSSRASSRTPGKNNVSFVDAGREALVVFADDTSLKCLRPLRRGFRHCFVAVASCNGWVICDPLSHQTGLGFVQGLSAADMASWYRSRGLRVIATRTRAAPQCPAPIRPFTCVEAVKRVLGLHAPWVVTPWQLYRLLQEVSAEDIEALDKEPMIGV